ncbi:MAG TPA: methionyl-tRNA formyltransferase [Candidatus Dormibacteraeota bacterium]|nr:methionyl-tRNA formyltransferase [Candidatus Dormibacteraeota bacterium]
MRLVFAGTAPFAVPSLQALIAARHELSLVITQPDRPGNRGKIQAPAVKQAALRQGLHVYQPDRVGSPEALAQVRWAAPELMVVVAYGQILPTELLEIPPLGVINVHASLLPRHRGAAPIARAILAGDPVTGVSIMRMDEQLDHGPVLATRELPIGPANTAVELTESLAALGAELLVEVLADLEGHPPVEQDHSAATAAPRLRREDGQVEWSLPAIEVDRKVRALNPWPGTTATLAGKELKLLRGVRAEGRGAPGEIIRVTSEGLLVATGEGAYRVEEVQLPSRRPMPARQLLP